jgi:hypothetical protein
VKAICRIRPQPHYRRDAFEKGLTKVGYRIVEHARPESAADLLILWNRMGQDERDADEWESDGGTVIVCENGYMGRDENGHQLYAMSVHGHNGSGWFPVGDGDRFGALGIELKPWCSNHGGHVLLCAQRGIGSQLMASPRRWDIDTAARVRAMGFKHVRVRQHPGRVPVTQPLPSLDQDLEEALACLIWSSASGVRALQRGIPVAFTAPHWVASGAAGRGLAGLQRLVQDDDSRLKTMQTVAWGQRTISEIESGEPFDTLVKSARRAAA